MRETQAIIERVRRVSTDLQQLELGVDSSLVQLQPGQSLFACSPEDDGWHPYLRKQMIPVGIQGQRLTVEITVEHVYAPGTVLSVLAPVGKPIPQRPGAKQILLIAQDTTPTPLVWPARQYISSGAAVTLVISGQAALYPLELFPPEIEILRGDADWTWNDQVQTLGWADQIIALAPSYLHDETYGHLYNRVSQLRQQSIPDGFLCGLYYARLACGTGACQACQIPGHKHNGLSCTDGPAIDLKEVSFKS